MPFEKMAERFLAAEPGSPRAENHIRYGNDWVVLDIADGNEDKAKRLRAELKADAGLAEDDRPEFVS